MVRKLFIGLILFSVTTTSFSEGSSSNGAKNLYMEEYTYIGVKNCLDKKGHLIGTKKTKGKVTIGSKEYFGLLESCFSRLKKSCEIDAESRDCNDYNKMKMRLDGVEIADKFGPEKEKYKGKIIDTQTPGKLETGLVDSKMIKRDKYTEYTDQEIAEAKKQHSEIVKKVSEFSKTKFSLQCASVNDCEALPVGDRICGGPESYLVLSKLSTNYDMIQSKLESLNKEIDSYHSKLKGIAGLCAYEVKPKLACVSNRCKEQ